MKMEEERKQEERQPADQPLDKSTTEGKPCASDGFCGDGYNSLSSPNLEAPPPAGEVLRPYSFGRLQNNQQPSSTTIHFGAFRPLTTDGGGDGVIRPPGSAFIANVFSLGCDPGDGSGHNQVGSSTQSPKLNSQEIKEERLDADDERTTPDENSRSLRKPKKRPFSDSNSPCCPVCSVTVRPSDLLTHFQQEVVRLDHVAKLADRSVNRPSRESTPHGRGSTSPSGSRRKEISEKTESRWEVYERTKNNRNSRLTAKANRGQKKSDSTTCPVCNESLSGTPEELNLHVDLCLRRRDGSSEEDEQVDVEGDETFEEYDWAGQTRIRPLSLVPGGFRSFGFQTHNRRNNNNNKEEEEDLNVDGDDSATFGKAQYGEADVIPCKTDESKEDKQRTKLRMAVLRYNENKERRRNAACSETESSGEPGEPSISPSTSKWITTAVSTEYENLEQQQACSTTTGEQGEHSSQDFTQVISSLKERILELENQQNGGDRVKCLICMEHYIKPVVSIGCWHVHCEECWLRTLGAKKLCPQCNMITSPTDLRRIYI